MKSHASEKKWMSREQVTFINLTPIWKITSKELVVPEPSSNVRIDETSCHTGLSHFWSNSSTSSWRGGSWWSQPYLIHTTQKIWGSWCHWVDQKNCVKMCCLLAYKSYSGQQQADLPLDRVSPEEPPFTYVGVDYFRPFGVKRGWSVVKRYGVIYKWQHLLTQTLSWMKYERLIRSVRNVLNSTLNVQIWMRKVSTWSYVKLRLFSTVVQSPGPPQI